MLAANELKGRHGHMPDWRLFLTQDERTDLEGLETNAQRVDKRRKKLTQAITVLRSRACSRRRLRYFRLGLEAEAGAKSAASDEVPDERAA